MYAHASALAFNAVMGAESDEDCNLCSSTRSLFFNENICLTVYTYCEDKEYDFILESLRTGMTEGSAEEVCEIAKACIHFGTGHELMGDLYEDEDPNASTSPFEALKVSRDKPTGPVKIRHLTLVTNPEKADS